MNKRHHEKKIVFILRFLLTRLLLFIPDPYWLLVTLPTPYWSWRHLPTCACRSTLCYVTRTDWSVLVESKTSAIAKCIGRCVNNHNENLLQRYGRTTHAKDIRDAVQHVTCCKDKVVEIERPILKRLTEFQSLFRNHLPLVPNVGSQCQLDQLPVVISCHRPGRVNLLSIHQFLHPHL